MMASNISSAKWNHRGAYRAKEDEVQVRDTPRGRTKRREGEGVSHKGNKNCNAPLDDIRKRFPAEKFFDASRDNEAKRGFGAVSATFG